MVMDALRGYVQLASGLTEVTRQKAQAAAKALLQQTGAENLTSGLTTKVSDLADEIVATSKSNRQLLQAIVTNEVEGAVARLGFARSEEVAALTRRIQTLEAELAAARAAAAAPAAASTAAAADVTSTAATADATSPVEPAGDALEEAVPGPLPTKTAAKKAAVKKATKKAAVKKAPAKKTAKKA
ncbi:phasin family protein [Kribbella swartbergensis]